MPEKTPARTVREIDSLIDAFAREAVGLRFTDDKSTYVAARKALDDAIEALAEPPDHWNRRSATGWTDETLPEMGKRVMLWAHGQLHWTAIVPLWRASEIAEIDAWRYIDPPGPVDEKGPTDE